MRYLLIVFFVFAFGDGFSRRDSSLLFEFECIGYSESIEFFDSTYALGKSQHYGINWVVGKFVVRGNRVWLYDDDGAVLYKYRIKRKGLVYF